MTWGHWRAAALGSLAMVAALAPASFASPRKVFPTPEAAVEHFVKSLAADDLDAAMQAFAIEERVALAQSKYGKTWRIRDLKTNYADLASDLPRIVEVTTVKEYEARTK